MKKIFFIKSFLILIALTGYAQVDIPDSLLTAPQIKTFIKDGNVFVTLTNGTQKQLTFTRSDERPFVLKSVNKILFIRNENVVKGDAEYTRKKIMTVDVNSFEEETIADAKPYKDGADNTYEIMKVENPCLSIDEGSLFFITPHTSTTHQLVKLDLDTKKWNQLFSAESFELIRTGQFAGCFLVGQFEIGTRGKGIYYYMLDSQAKRLKEFADKEAMEQFKKAVQ
jgi:hypothetical protein